MKKLVNNFSISILESAGFVVLLIAIIQIIITIIYTKNVEELGYKIIIIIASLGWFGVWAILWSKNARKTINGSEVK